MIEEYKALYKEKEQCNNNYNDIEETKLNNTFSLSSIDFIETKKNLEKDKKMRENELLDNKKEENIDVDEILIGLKIDMRKDLYQLIDESNNKMELNKLMGRKRKETISLPPLPLLHEYEYTKKKYY